MRVRVLLADDHELFREALRSLLDGEASFEVVGEAADGHEVLELARALKPDVVCMDIRLPGMNGVEVTRRLVATSPGVKVVGLSAFTERHYVFQMLDAGASGYVAKARASDELVRAVKAVHSGREYLCPAAAAAVEPGVGASHKAGEASGDASLGTRERQVLKLVAEGHTVAQIGERLHLPQSAVEVHRTSVMRKLQLRSIADLAGLGPHDDSQTG